MALLIIPVRVPFLSNHTKQPGLYGEVGIFFHFAVEVLGIQKPLSELVFRIFQKSEYASKSE